MKTIVRILMTAAAVMMFANFANAQATYSVCAGTGVVTFQANNGGADATSDYLWTTDDLAFVGGIVDTKNVQMDFTTALANDVINLTVYEIIDGCIGTTWTMAVTVRPLPTVTLALTSGNVNGNVCSGDAITFDVTLTAGTSPFDFNYTIGGGAEIPVSGVNSVYELSVAGIAVNTDYVITEVTDQYCTSTGLSVTETVTVQTFGTTGIIAL